MTRFRTTLLLATGLSAGLLIGSAVGTAQEPGASQADMMALAQPGPEHAELSRLVGSWGVEARLWMAPGAEPMVEGGIAKVTKLLGGRFLQIHVDGSFGGMPFESETFLGFDRAKKEYILLGMDSFGTYWVEGRGPKPEAGEPIVMSGEFHEPTMDITQKYRVFLRNPSPGRFSMEWEMTFPGQDPYTMVKINYRKHTAEANAK